MALEPVVEEAALREGQVVWACCDSSLAVTPGHEGWSVAGSCVSVDSFGLLEACSQWKAKAAFVLRYVLADEIHCQRGVTDLMPLP